jgi:tRNA(adenine34) deaminase
MVDQTLIPTQLESDEHWMRRALALAELGAAAGEVPVGAVVVRDGEVLGEGCNRPIGDRDPTAHAEIVALRAAAATVENYRLTGATLYVTVEPCTMCAGALVHARIARLIFGAPEPRSGAVVTAAQVLDNPGHNHRVAVTGGVLAAESAALLKAFFAARRRGRDEQVLEEAGARGCAADQACAVGQQSAADRGEATES